MFCAAVSVSEDFMETVLFFLVAKRKGLCQLILTLSTSIITASLGSTVIMLEAVFPGHVLAVYL